MARQFDTIIKGGTVHTGAESKVADVAIKGEKIAKIAKNLSPDGATIIDAAGKLVLPGMIDVHVHLQLPFCGTVSSDDFESGTRAAARGGVTTVIDYATQDKEKGMYAGFERRMAEARDKVAVDYGLHGIVIQWTDQAAAEVKKMIDAGVPTYKMFMIYEKEGWQSDDAAMYAALEYTRDFGAKILVHAESERVLNVLIGRYVKEMDKVGAYGHALSRPNFVEAEAIQRAIMWTEQTGGTLYIVHMSTGEGADLVKAAKSRGVHVYAETCPQYLVLNDEVFKDREKGHWYATCPQIKKKKDNERLWKGLKNGEVSTIATDTCTFTTKQKAMWGGDFRRIPFGLPGVETMWPAIYTFGVRKKKFDVNHAVTLCSTNPAKLMGLHPRKGALAAGSDADVIVIDPKAHKKIDYKELATNCDWSPYQGMDMYGFPETTLCRGAVVVRDHQ
ncbi:MAG: dihydropyrimidinase, partial [Candidatus Lindowbacteria bacterium RIFCSPLOWO2_02_FULL_62_12]